MSKESNIDKLFSEGLENQRHAFNPNNWEKMEAMLDNAPATTYGSWNWKLTGVAALFLCLSSGVFITSEKNPIPSSTSLITMNKGEHAKAELSNLITNTLRKDQLSSTQTSPTNEQMHAKAQNPVITDKSAPQRNTVEITPIQLAGINWEKQDVNVLLDFENNRGSSYDYTSSVKDENSAHFNEGIVLLDPKTWVVYEEVEELAQVNYTDPVEPDLLQNSRSELSFGGFNTFNHGFSNQSGLLGKNILHRLELQYSFQVTKNLAFVSGVGYSSKSANGLNYSSEQEELSFGKKANSTVIQIQSLNYIEVPFMLRFDLKGKHEFTAGVGLAYLMAVRNRVLESNFETLNGSEVHSSTQWGGKERFNSIDYSLGVSYFYGLSQKLAVGVSGQFGLSDYSNNSAWNSNQRDLHQEIQVGLKYKFLSF